MVHARLGIAAENSGEHDLERVLSLARHFQIHTAIFVNKFDINEEMTRQIEEKAKSAGAGVAGCIRHDSSVIRAQI